MPVLSGIMRTILSPDVPNDLKRCFVFDNGVEEYGIGLDRERNVEARRDEESVWDA